MPATVDRDNTLGKKRVPSDPSSGAGVPADLGIGPAPPDRLQHAAVVEHGAVLGNDGLGVLVLIG